MAVLYISFDDLTQHKGASVHIHAFCQVLSREFAPLHLLTVSATNEPISTYQIHDRFYHTQLPARGKNLIDRILDFRRQVQAWLAGKYFQVIHFRSIVEGFWLVRERQRYADYFIFEVNGLPSIEWKYRYPDLIEDHILLGKLKAQEDYCLQHSDRVITPSPVTAEYLQKRGTDPQKIMVIPNGVDPQLFAPPPTKIPKNYYQIVYFGTFAGWQGWELAVRATAQLSPHFHLLLIGQGNKTQLHTIRKLVQKLALDQRTQLLPPMPQSELVTHLQQSDILLAPLTLCDRNVVQGCCPLKVLEGMAVGTPVITSDLPVVRCLGEDRQHFLLVKPNSIAEIVSAITELVQHPHLAQYLARQARLHILNHFTWAQATHQLLQVYRSLSGLVQL